MYPLLLKPVVKDYIWGGDRLKTEFGLDCDTNVAAEGWMLSCHQDGPCVVANGKYTGMTLPEVLEVWNERALGKNAARFPYFPLLIKLIDAKQSLSVQVHPNDEYALKHEGEFGKTEMWYVVDCDEGAELIYGFKEPVTKEELKSRIEQNTLTDICNRVAVHKGDVFLISAGTLHAIGGGILIAEVQQNSNATYRVYDYGRKDAGGNLRPLHVEKALDVTLREPPALPFGQVGEVTAHGKNTVRALARCDLFSADLLSLKAPFTVHCNDSFIALICLDGNATLSYDDGKFDIKKGDSIFVPAGLTVTIDGTAEILYNYV